MTGELYPIGSYRAHLQAYFLLELLLHIFKKSSVRHLSETGWFKYTLLTPALKVTVLRPSFVFYVQNTTKIDYFGAFSNHTVPVG